MSTEPASLTPEEERAWRSLIRLMVLLPRAIDEDLTRRGGISTREPFPGDACASVNRLTDRVLQRLRDAWPRTWPASAPSCWTGRGPTT